MRYVAIPDWLAHPFRWQRLPLPWAAIIRGGLGAGALLGAGVATGHASAGVAAGLGAMLAGVNDRPGTRRAGIVQIGLPALAGSFGMLLGGLLAAAGAVGWAVVPALFAVGLVSGAVSAAGPVSSAAGMQLLVTTVVGSGMPLPLEPWQKAVCYLAGAAWLLLLRLVLRPPRPAGGPLSDERAAVAGVFDALADALTAAGGPGGEAARRRLTAALNQAVEGLRLRRLLHPRLRTEELLLRERFAAATAMCEASVALLWEGSRLPSRVAEGPRRLAEAVRSGQRPGPLPAPASSTAARHAFDRAVLDAAVVFARTAPLSDRPAAIERDVRRRRTVLGPAGRLYGLRVALCVAASVAVALLLRTEHWYWLPATAAFLVKPDLGPLFSRTVNRFAGTAAGVLFFPVAAAALSGAWLPMPQGWSVAEWWPVAVVACAGALVPVATRHFAFQTAVVTVIVLSFLQISGDTDAAVNRLTDTSIACAIVLLIGHLPRLADQDRRVGHRIATALRATEAYLGHVLSEEAAAAATFGDRSAERLALRRTAYRTLGEARVAATTAAAELPSARDRAAEDWLRLVAGAERIVDATTACAVRLDHGAPWPRAAQTRQLTSVLSGLADAFEGTRRGRLQRVAAVNPVDRAAVSGCATLTDVVTELEHIRGVATAA